MRYIAFITISLFCSTCHALGWEQTGYITLASGAKIVHLDFNPTHEQESRGLMVYSNRSSQAHRFCVPRSPGESEENQELHCSSSEFTRPTRIYKSMPPSKAAESEARHIYDLYRRGKNGCVVWDYSGFLVCSKGCETDVSKVLVKIETSECVE